MDNLETTIKDYLIKTQLLEEVDTTLIEELLFNINLSNRCKEDILLEGYKINITQSKNKKAYWIKNQSFIAYQACLKNITTIMASLGLTPRERQKFKIAIQDPDNFDKIMNS
jgi:P27 family predicted phage terminase small subunit